MKKFLFLLMALFAVTSPLYADPTGVPLTVKTLPQEGDNPRSPIVMPVFYLDGYTLTASSNTVGSTVELPSRSTADASVTTEKLQTWFPLKEFTSARPTTPFNSILFKNSIVGCLSVELLAGMWCALPFPSDAKEACLSGLYGKRRAGGVPIFLF